MPAGAFYERTEQPPRRAAVERLCEEFAAGHVSRRDFMRRATAMGGWCGSRRSARLRPAEVFAQQTAAASTKIPLDVAEWSYMWVNVKRAETARGAFVGGQQMSSV